MSSVNLLHISLYPVEGFSAGSAVSLLGKEIQSIDKVKLKAEFPVSYVEGAKRIQEWFDATFEYDSSFGFHRMGESISGQIGANDRDQLAFIEIHGCQNPDNFDRLVELVTAKEAKQPEAARNSSVTASEHSSIAVQIMELGQFFSTAEFRKLLVAS